MSLNIDFSKADKYPVRIKITKVELPAEGQRMGYLTVEGLDNRKLPFFNDAKFIDQLKEGVEEDAVVTVQAAKSGDGSMFVFVSSFGKTAARPGAASGSRQGSYTPKQPAEYLAGPVSAIVIRAFELSGHVATGELGSHQLDIQQGMQIAQAMLETFKVGLAKMVGAAPAPAAAAEPKQTTKAAAKAEAPAPSAEDQAKAARINFAKKIFNGDKSKLDAFKADLTKAGKDYAAVMDAAIAAVVEDEQALRENAGLGEWE